MQKNKVPRNKFNQEVKGHYFENYKTLMKEIEENTNKWKICIFLFPFLWPASSRSEEIQGWASWYHSEDSEVLQEYGLAANPYNWTVSCFFW